MQSRITSSNLEKCPFCGNSAEFIKTSGSFGGSSDKMKIKCTGCWLETPDIASEAWVSGVGTFDISDKTIAKLTETWNTRSKP